MNPSHSRESVSFNHATMIIGLEIHVQLATESKLFCRCSTEYGAEPNTQTCPICAGMPGALPVLNPHALFLAIKTGLALDCTIARKTQWDRKSYFYRDLPKGYQISQRDEPICGPGFLEFPAPQHPHETRRIEIERAHVEEDAGKSISDVATSGRSKIDLNRAGIPLLEIVTRPDMRSPAEAKAFLIELKLILTYLEITHGVMAHGNLRCDANINLHIETNMATVMTPIVELKNLNSFKAIERALAFEGQRQFESWKKHGITIIDAPKQTRGWDDTQQVTVVLRNKETAADYRFLPDPDLPPMEISNALIESAETILECCPLPSQWRTFLTDVHRIRTDDANVIVAQGRGVVDYFLSLVGENGDSQIACNWVTQEVLRHLNESQIEIEQFPVNASELGELLVLIQKGDLGQSRGKEVLDKMIAEDLKLSDAILQLEIHPVSLDEIKSLCERVMDENVALVKQIQNGNSKAIGALIGLAKTLNPNVHPGFVNDQFRKLIDKSSL